MLNEVVHGYNGSIYQHCDRTNAICELLAVKHDYLDLHLFSSLVYGRPM